ncbi:MAG: hypothetical protein L0K10_08160, partial [Brevibacterium aurantiacum]|nr:hypothetical protein [Brevibacterium aurantiacum]
MPPSSLLPTRLPAFRLLVLGIVLGLVVLILGPAQSPAAASTTSASAGTGSAGEDSDASRPPDGKTIVYGIPGLTINDIDPVRTPNLYELFSNGSAANLNVRTIGSATCPGSGWLSMGAGARAEAGPPIDPEDEGNKSACPPLSAPSTSDEAVEQALEQAEGSTPAGGSADTSSDEDLAESSANGT